MKYFNKTNIKNSIFPILIIVFIAINFINREQFLSLFATETKVDKTFAEVAVVKNEVKKKKNNSMNWDLANETDSISRGDSMSTGSLSSALVKFKDGQSMTLDQNTLIVFDENVDEAEFVSGNIKLNVRGSLKIKVDNEVLTFSGKKAGVQLFKDSKKNKKNIVLLEGSTKVASKKSIVKLEKNKVIESKQVVVRPEVYAQENPHAQPVQYEEFNSVAEVETKLVEIEKAEAVATAAEEPDEIIATNETQQPVVEEPTPIQPEQPAVPVVYYYKLYDYYSKKPNSHFDFVTKENFVEKPNGQFQNFNKTKFTYKGKLRIQNQKAVFSAQIKDTETAMGYLAEISNTPSFSREATKYFWTKAQIEYTFTEPGNYFLRYRKVLNDQVLTNYSSTSKVIILPDNTKLNLAIAKLEEKEKKYLAEKAKAKEVAQFSLTERTPAALDPAQSTITIIPETLKNIKYSESYVDVTASQGYLVSNQQFERSHPYSQSYNLGFDITHYWNANNGVSAQINKSMVSTDSANSVMDIELEYMYRVIMNSSILDSNSYQLQFIAAYENYQITNATADYKSSYNLTKIGVGATIPVFNSWSLDLNTLYGTGPSATSLQLLTRANYYYKQNASLGLGFRARKYDYTLNGTQNMESFSETLTSFRYHY